MAADPSKSTAEHLLAATPHPTQTPPRTAPTFYVTGPQPVRPAAVLLALLIAAAALSVGGFALNHSRNSRHAGNAYTDTQSAASDADDDKDDDPSKVDTIYLGDPADAPEPATRHRRSHVGSVHPTILIRLPRSGPLVGTVPNSPAGHLLYAWLAAFNQASEPALKQALPGLTPASAASAQMELQRQTGGFNLLSAKEVEPGLLVFRLRDQTPNGTEALGTLHMLPDASPPAIATFSLRAVASPDQSSTPTPPAPNAP